MRKIKILLILILLVSFCSINIKATSTQITNVTISNENGFVVETIITEDIDIARVNQKSGTKTVNYYNKLGTSSWAFPRRLRRSA